MLGFPLLYFTGMIKLLVGPRLGLLTGSFCDLRGSYKGSLYTGFPYKGIGVLRGSSGPFSGLSLYGLSRSPFRVL